LAGALVSERFLEDGTMVLELRGELDLAVDDALREVLIDTIRTRRPPGVIVSVRHVPVADSTAMGALVAGHNAARIAGIRYVVQYVAPVVEKQLPIAGIHERLVSPTV
jgi:anti-anti-sigma factor